MDIPRDPAKFSHMLQHTPQCGVSAENQGLSVGVQTAKVFADLRRRRVFHAAAIFTASAGLATHTPDFSLIRGPVPVHQNPFGVFIERRSAERPQDQPPFGVILSVIQAPERVEENPQHEFVLLYELSLCCDMGVIMPDRDQQQHGAHRCH